MDHGESLFFSASDGLRLHVRRHGPRGAAKPLVVCLPGLTRNTEDFDAVGADLAELGHCVVALDYRGRGRSEFDPNRRNYDIRVELDDVMTVLAALGHAEACFIGTSRGGLILAAMAAARPNAIRGVVLNDIGPVIEGQGLARIRGYVGKMPMPGTPAEGALILKRLGADQFPAFNDADWEGAARRTWDFSGTAVRLKYDTNLMQPLAEIDIDKPMPDLWPAFEALAHAPCLVIRGALSDLLSHETALEMTRRHPDCRMITVPGQGHAPHLDGPQILAAIRALVARAEVAKTGASPAGLGQAR